MLMVGAPIEGPEAAELALPLEWCVARNAPAPAAAAIPAMMSHFFLLMSPLSPPGSLVMETAGPVPLPCKTGAIDDLAARDEGSMSLNIWTFGASIPGVANGGTAASSRATGAGGADAICGFATGAETSVDAAVKFASNNVPA
jgi:hypothetical protein